MFIIRGNKNVLFKIEKGKSEEEINLISHVTLSLPAVYQINDHLQQWAFMPSIVFISLCIIHSRSYLFITASVQFKKPFDYSTSSWVNNNECDKDVTKFKSVQVTFTVHFMVKSLSSRNKV